MLCPPLALQVDLSTPSAQLLVMLDSVLADGVDLSEPDQDGNTPLHRGVKVALGECIGEMPLIEEVDAPTATTSDIASRLASILSHRSAAALAAAHQLHNKDGYMPLHIAVTSGSVSICEVLLKAGAPINAYTLRRDWHVHLQGHVLTCGYWAKRDKFGNIDIKASGKTSLHLAVGLLLNRLGHDKTGGPDTALVQLLLKHGSSVDAADSWGRNSLQMAAAGGLYDVVELLASSAGGSSITRSRALHVATIRGDVRMVELLMRLGAQTDVYGLNGLGDGWTPLCLAARSGATDVAKALILGRANVHATSTNGKTALEIAAVNSNRKGGLSVLEALQVETVASVLEIAFHRRPPAPPRAPRLTPTAISLPPEASMPLPPALYERGDGLTPPLSKAKGISLLAISRPVMFWLPTSV